MNLKRRLFQIPDADLIQAGEVMELKLPDDLAAFTAFDSTITANYPAEIRQLLNEVRSYKPDYLVRKDQENLGAAFDAAYEHCLDEYRTILFFVKKAYKDNPSMQKSFGVGVITKTKRMQAGFIRFMEQLCDTLTANKNDLVAVGCSQAVVDGFAGVVDALRQADNLHEGAKKDRRVTTEARTAALNSLAGKLVAIEKAAKVIFKTDEAKKQKYMLPKPSVKDELPESEAPAASSPQQ